MDVGGCRSDVGCSVRGSLIRCIQRTKVMAMESEEISIAMCRRSMVYPCRQGCRGRVVGVNRNEGGGRGHLTLTVARHQSGLCIVGLIRSGRSIRGGRHPLRGRFDGQMNMREGIVVLELGGVEVLVRLEFCRL